MPIQTKRERVVEHLKALGARQIQGKSAKYLTFQVPWSRLLYFVGKAGALRIGRTVSTSSSRDADAWMRNNPIE